ncbi:MAG: FAD-binding protein [Actinomycetota bacterium]|nr:FAD-binding protein [Actinomycetota bacterium]
MRTYGQFCPIARASEILAQRWNPIILRNLLLGRTTFTEIAEGAPGLSRALLTKRLREFERAGLIQITPKADGHGSRYEPTQAGRDLEAVLRAMYGWADKWMEVTRHHADPDAVLWSWCTFFLRRESLPEDRVLVRFEFAGDQPGYRRRFWLLFEDGNGEVCRTDPGYEESLRVVVYDPRTFARWHMGLVEWSEALRAGDIEVTGRRDLAAALPTWNAGPDEHLHRRQTAGEVRTRPHLDLDTQRATPSPPPPSFTGGGGRGDSPIPHFEGEVLTPDQEGYDEARSIWNGAIDKHPRYIARCQSASDVAAVLRFARESGLDLSVRAGGHGVAGTALCDDGVVADLSPMRRIEVDPAAGTARVGAGALWGELDAATQAFGLATTGGVVSHTGVAGLTLGGGIGWLMRRHGLTIDNLESAEVVTADGTRVTASRHEHPDLFWGLRGGGGNFGVVTSFTYRLHRIGPDVLAGPVYWAMEDAAEALGFYAEYVEDAPPESNTLVFLRKAPPAPFLPKEMHGRLVCVINMLWTGRPEQAATGLARLRGFGRPLLDLVGVRPYTDLQSMGDAFVPHGWHYYWKSAELGRLDEGAIEDMIEHASRIESAWSYAVMFQLGGAVAEVAEDATAYPDRQARHNLNINGVWLPHQQVGERETAWTREFHSAMRSHKTGAYLNFLDRDDGVDAVRTTFGEDKYRRLIELKRRYDPDNVFSSNHNITPTRPVEPGRPETLVETAGS